MSNFIKIFLLIIEMVLGFFLSYSLIAMDLGVEFTEKVAWICAFLAILSDALYLWWVCR